MARLSDLYPSKYLSAGDLEENGIIVTIRSIDIEKMRDGTEKPVLYFDEVEKGLALNKTNAKSIEKMYGEETDAWEDERITLYPSEVNFNNDIVPCIRVKPKRPVPTVKKAKATAAAATDDKLPKAGKANPMTQAEVDDDDDSAPF